MDRWTREGGRSMTLYLAAWVEAFWIAVAFATRGAEWLSERMTPAEGFAVGAMVGWMAGLVLYVVTRGA